MTDEINRARLALWRNFLVVPHRDLSVPVASFSEALKSDPEFIGKAMYAMSLPKFNRIRDLVEAGTIVLLTAPSEFQILRRTGAWLFGRLPPYQAIRVDDFVETKLKVNRHSRKASERYLKSIFTNQNRLEGAIMRPGVWSGFRRMAIRYHVPGKELDLLQKIIFDKKAIEGGKTDILSQIAKLDDPLEQAKLAAGKGLTDTVLSSVLIPHPATVAVRLESMTPAEALNARGWLEEGGFLEVPELFGLWEVKAGQSQNVSSASVEGRKSVQRGTDAKVQAVVDNAQTTSARKDQIDRDILLVVDISGSMDQNDNIKIAIAFGERIASRCRGRIMVTACNNFAREVMIGNGWKQGFGLLRPDGNTSLGSGLKYAVDHKFIPETVVVITDDGENAMPAYSTVEEFADSEHIFLTTGDYQGASYMAEKKGWNVSRFPVKQDYAALDQISVLLQRPPKRSIVDDILSLSFPVR